VICFGIALGWIAGSGCAPSTAYASSFGPDSVVRKSTARPRAIYGPPAPSKPSYLVKYGRRVTKRKPNDDGKVLILQYHHVEDKDANWTRKTKEFRHDLERLYKLGYRPVTLREYLDNNVLLAPGATPVVMTFDDSHPDQFRMLKDGSIDPTCAVGIWKRFADKHPDFPVKGTFFVVPRMYFGQKKFLKKKMAMLKEWGCDVEIHTLSHANLSTLTDDEVKAEIAGSIEWIRQFGFEPKTIALPYGIAPKNRVLLKEFVHKGVRYKLDAAVLAGSGPAPAPQNAHERVYRLPRILAQEGEYGSTWWLDRAKAGKVDLYVTP